MIQCYISREMKAQNAINVRNSNNRSPSSVRPAYEPLLHRPLCLSIN